MFDYLCGTLFRVAGLVISACQAMLLCSCNFPTKTIARSQARLRVFCVSKPQAKKPCRQRIQAEPCFEWQVRCFRHKRQFRRVRQSPSKEFKVLEMLPELSEQPHSNKDRARGLRRREGGRRPFQGSVPGLRLCVTMTTTATSTRADLHGCLHVCAG